LSSGRSSRVDDQDRDDESYFTSPAEYVDPTVYHDGVAPGEDPSPYRYVSRIRVQVHAEGSTELLPTPSEAGSEAQPQEPTQRSDTIYL